MSTSKRPPPYSPVRRSSIGDGPNDKDAFDYWREEMSSRRRSLDGSIPWRQLCWVIVEVFLAETVGTAMLVFFGCAGVVAWSPDRPAVDSMQGPVVFAVVVSTIIQIFGHISAAHLNPAVTIAFTVLGRVSPGMALIYICSECFGAMLGYGLLILLTPADVLGRNGSLCCTVPNAGLSDLQAVAMEFCATCFLIMVVCACEDPRNADKADSTPLKFGCTILALSIAVGPYTGASLNPARTLGPAVWTNTWTSYWVYWLGPCLSGFATALFYQAFFNRQSQEADAQRLEELNLVKVPSRRDRGREEMRAT